MHMDAACKVTKQLDGQQLVRLAQIARDHRRSKYTWSAVYADEPCPYLRGALAQELMVQAEKGFRS